MPPKTLDGQRLIVPPDARCDACSSPSPGVLTHHAGRALCRPCYDAATTPRKRAKKPRKES